MSESAYRGVMVRPNPYAGRNLEDPGYDDFYAAISDLDVPIATHEGSGVWMPEYGSVTGRASRSTRCAIRWSRWAPCSASRLVV